MIWWQCILTAIAIALAHHLGLIEKVSEVASQICRCPRCSVFWGMTFILILRRVDLGIALVTALALAYLTDWLGLLFGELAILYEELWKRQRRRRTRRSP